MEKDQIGFLPTKGLWVIIPSLMLSVFGFYLWKFGELGIGDQAVWGQFGDYFGGVLNPILSFSAFMVLIYTYKAQIKDQLQNVENDRFFERISMLNQMAGSVEIDVENIERDSGNSDEVKIVKQTFSGHRALGRSWNTLKKKLAAIKSEDTNRQTLIALEYFKWQKIYWQSIESYYDSSIFIVDTYLCPENVKDRKYYAGVLRSQMSSSERNMFYLLLMDDDKGRNKSIALSHLGFWRNCDPIVLELGPVIHMYCHDLTT